VKYRAGRAAGISKLFMPKEKLVTFPGSGWVEGFRPGALKTISILEILGAVGLIMPAVLDIAPVLVHFPRLTAQAG